jgi:ABC-2 type transport system ATP-binding protein
MSGHDLAIEVIDFRKVFSETVAADGITFALPRGVIGALVGPNGAGKTTTMRALCGVLRPTSGQLRIAGFEVQQQPLEVKRRVAYVPDDPPLFETLTVWEHILFIASAYGVNNYLETGELLLQQFELTNKRNALASELSRGMRQKVAIACAYLHQPEVMLFDEPLTGLDPAAIRMLKESMRQKAAGGATVLVSSHLLALVEDICEYLIVFQNGKCLFSGTLPEARQAHPEAVSLEDVFFRFTESKSVKETSDAPK